MTSKGLADEHEAKSVVSQMKTVIRPMYSNPPRQGSRLVTTILEDPKLTQDFLDQCKGMADRINSMRSALVDELVKAGSTKNWDHITKQIGMFAYSGLNKEQVMTMREKQHVYCTGDGRISMAVSFLCYTLERTLFQLTLESFIFKGCHNQQC